MPVVLLRGWEPAGDALGDLGHAPMVEMTWSQEELWQGRPPADDDASDHPGATVEQAKGHVDKAQRWPYDGADEQLGAGLLHGLDLPGHVSHQHRLVTVADDEALVPAEQAALVAELELLAGPDLRIDDPHASRAHGDVVDVAPGAGLAPVVEGDDPGDGVEDFADLLLARGAGHPGPDMLGCWLCAHPRDERRLDTPHDGMLLFDPSPPLPVGSDAMFLALAMPLEPSLCLPGDRPAGGPPLECSRVKTRSDLIGALRWHGQRAETGQARDCLRHAVPRSPVADSQGAGAADAGPALRKAKMRTRASSAVPSAR